MESKQPNVLLITVDHWPGTLLQSNALIAPTLNQLMRNGTQFTRAYTECPICIPARRTLMTGTTPRTHGDRSYNATLPMPNIPTLAQVFRENGYQTFAVGKLHVYPQRNRIGFDDVLLDEEGRTQFGVIDDYDMFLRDRGYPGAQFAHGMSNNEYHVRPWHLAEELHVTNWATREMCRAIKRRDPTRPGLWYLSYRHPHPPLVPLPCYLDMYANCKISPVIRSAWSQQADALPYAVRAAQLAFEGTSDEFVRVARGAFYALCTQIDHQLRLVIGVLREEKLLDNTILLFHSDHGDMLGDHGLWQKTKHYEGSARIPMILMGTAECTNVRSDSVDSRLVGLQDIMPTLLDLAGIGIPPTVEGLSMVREKTREYFMSEYGENEKASRMVTDGRYKLIYYPCGNRRQLFDLNADPHELQDLAAESNHGMTVRRLTDALVAHFYGSDLNWIKSGELCGTKHKNAQRVPNRGLDGQRGAF